MIRGFSILGSEKHSSIPRNEKKNETDLFVETKLRLVQKHQVAVGFEKQDITNVVDLSSFVLLLNFVEYSKKLRMIKCVEADGPFRR